MIYLLLFYQQYLFFLHPKTFRKFMQSLSSIILLFPWKLKINQFSCHKRFKYLIFGSCVLICRTYLSNLKIILSLKIMGIIEILKMWISSIWVAYKCIKLRNVTFISGYWNYYVTKNNKNFTAFFETMSVTLVREKKFLIHHQIFWKRVLPIKINQNRLGSTAMIFWSVC